MRTISSSLLTAAALIALQGTSHAAVLAYEGFNYSLADNVTINGATSTATGFGAGVNQWTVTNVLPGGGLASSNYRTAGLTFSNIQTTAGALQISTRFSGTAATSTAALALSVPVTTGTLWSSYLVRYNTIGDANNGSMMQAVSATTTGGQYFRAGQLSNQVVASRRLGVGYDSTLSQSTNYQFVDGNTPETYLFLSKFTNVGTGLSAGTPGVASTWVFTTTQYDLWQAAGGTEALLNTYATVRQTDTVTSSTYNFGSGLYAQFYANAPNINSKSEIGIFDELRYGTSLGDVIAVPEPSIATVFSIGLVGLMLTTRRRNSSM